MFLLNRDCHRRFLCVDCHPGYKRVLRLIYIYFCDILSSFYYYSNIKILKIKTPQRARARTCAHAHPKISKHAHAHARAREKILKVRTRTHAHSKFSNDAHVHARAREKFFKVRTRTHALAKIPSFLELWPSSPQKKSILQSDAIYALESA
jgi:hypothetical protein